MIIRVDEEPKRCRVMLEAFQWKYGYVYASVCTNDMTWRIVLWDDHSEPELFPEKNLRIRIKKHVSCEYLGEWIFPREFVLERNPLASGMFYGLIKMSETEKKALVKWDSEDFELIDPDKILIKFSEWSS